MLGLIAPTSGSAKIFEKDIIKDRSAILSYIGYLPSEAAFYHGMKVKDLLKLSADLRKQDCQKEAEKLCERLELDPSKKIRELSFGNRKKVGIICALQHQPQLYILDEPTSGLDPLMQREFFSILNERNQNGATIFLSSHILSEVARHCKHAAVIREGKILVTDSIEKLGHTGVKRVTLRGISEAPQMTLAKDMKIENDVAQFLYSGKPEQLLKELSALKFEDFNISDPDLEEIFMHYYAKEEL